ncbi:MAG: hypothetical protein SGI92_25095, partial [Bryobacteraceae bacterium]|nr:hypothetical protein [Bryobacteraceae bacterium]
RGPRGPRPGGGYQGGGAGGGGGYQGGGYQGGGYQGGGYQRPPVQQQQPPVQAQPPAVSGEGHGAIQPPPDALPRTGGPILPPLASPQSQPSWKQEVRPEPTPDQGGTPGNGETKE